MPATKKKTGKKSARSSRQVTIEEAPETEEQRVERQLSVTEIHYDEDDAVRLPKGMTLDTALELLSRRIRYEGEEVNVVEEFECFPLDGAHALFRVLQDRFGWAECKAKKTFFGPEPPTMINIKVGVSKTVSVPWGEYRLPGGKVDGTIETSYAMRDGRIVFVVKALIYRRDEAFVQTIFEDVRTYLEENSIYRGKAVSLRVKDDKGKPLPLPEPEFMDVDIDETKLAFPAETEEAIETNLFTPLRRLEDLVANGIPIKRGVLMGGPYGCGKTLSAKVASKYATQNGITFIYARRADEIAHIIPFAKQYADPAVVLFCEDIDAVVTEKRDQAVNDILNIVDGVDTKGMNLITLLTTNHVEDITRAMLRPGRLDAVIDVPAPDAETVEKLLRIYGEGVLPDNADLSTIGEELEGAIPAIIAEVVRRAKLHQLSQQLPGTAIDEISVDALMAAARTMRSQRKLLEDSPTKTGVSAGGGVGKVSVPS